MRPSISFFGLSSLLVVLFLLVSIQNLIAITFVQIGTGTSYNAATAAPTPYGTYYKNFRQQYLYKADEIIAAGGRAGTITSVAFYIQSLNGITSVPSYGISIKHTSQTSLSTTFEEGDYSLVWYRTFWNPTTTGWFSHVLDTPFVWDGTSNLLIDILTGMAPINGENSSVRYTLTSILFNSSLRYQSNITAANSVTTGTTSTSRANLSMTMLLPPLPASTPVPADGTTAFCNTSLLWDAPVGSVSGYKLYLGTDGGGTSTPTNIVNGLDLGNVTYYYPESYLPVNATIYWKIVPYNPDGDAVNCPIWRFTTTPLSGDFHVGVGAPLSTLTQAINLLNYSGVTSAGVVFKLANQTFAEATPIITTSGTESGRIIFEPVSESANPVLNLTGIPSITYGFKLDGADYITFNNIDIIGPHTIFAGYWLLHGATNNIITNCDINIPINLSYQNAAIYSKGANHNCSYTNNVISFTTYYGIFNEGVSGGIINNTIISGNVILYASGKAIYTDDSNQTTISNNQIYINPDNPVGITAICTGGTASQNEISGNLVTGSSPNFIIAIGTSGAYIHHNQLIDLHCHSTGDVRGISCVVGNLIIHDNVIKNLTFSGSGNYTVLGILNSGGTMKIYNNFIYGLYNPNGTIQPYINAIAGNFAHPSEICNNTIYLDASSTAVDFTVWAISLGVSSRVTVQNNIVINLSTPGSSGWVTALYSSTINVLASGSDRNIYYCGNPNAYHSIAVINGIPYPTLAEFKALASPAEQNSMTEQVPFISYTAPVNVHIRNDVPTLVEGNAIPLAWITHDIDGEARHSTNPDIGADEGNFIIKANPANLVSPSNGGNAFCNASLNWSYGGGVVNGYKLYFGTDGGGTSTPTNLVNGVDLGNVFTYTHPSFLPVNTTYYWKIVPYNSITEAQDCPIWSFQAVPLSGNVNLAPGLQFPDFTTAINVLNYSGTTGSGVTFLVSDATFTENTPVITYSGSETDRIVFEPVSESANPVLSVTDPAQYHGFRLSGADYITFRNIDVIGTNTLAFGYRIMDSSTHIVIENCNIDIPYNTGQSNSAITSYGASNNCSFIGNTISNNTIYGIYVAGGYNNLVQGNRIELARKYGIHINNSYQATVANNYISIDPSNTSYCYGIYHDIGSNLTEIYGNTITGTSNYAVYGIVLVGGSCNVHHNQLTELHSLNIGGVFGIQVSSDNKTIHSNVLSNFSYQGSDGYAARAINVNDASNLKIYNNMIYSMENPSGTITPQAFGIYLYAGGDTYVSNNTIFLNATGSPQNTNFRTTGIAIASGSSVVVQNNIVVNLSDTGGGGIASAIHSPNGTIAVIAANSDKNIYYCGTPGPSHPIGHFTSSTYNTMGDYKAALSYREQNSFTELVPFVSTSEPIDLHINPYIPTFVEGSAIPLNWVLYDIESDERNISNPDIGADEADLTPRPPASPILLSPSDQAVDVQTGTALTWKFNPDSNIPAYYKLYFGTTNPPPYVDDIYTTSYLSALEYEVTYYWYVTAVNVSGQANSATWSFTVCASPDIVSLPHYQNFDSVTTPALPSGWVGYKSISGMSVQTSTSYKNTSPNSVYMNNSTYTGETLRLISPEVLVPMNSYKLRFFARSGAETTSIKVGTVNSQGLEGVFTELTSFNLSMAFTEYTVFFNGYWGTDRYICFQHGMTATSRSIYIDTIKLEQLPPFDLAATVITGQDYGQVGTNMSFMVSVANRGLNPVNMFNLNLKRAGGDLLSTVLVSVNVSPGQTRIHHVSWTPTIAENLSVVGEVEMIEVDENSDNNETPIKNLAITIDGHQSLQIGDGASTGQHLPVEPYFTYSYSQSLFLQSELNIPDKTIVGLSWYYNGNSAWSEPNIDIYLGHTSRNAFSSYTNYVALDSLTLVYSGPYNVSATPGWINFTFSSALAYNNVDNLVVAVNENGGPTTAYHSNSDEFYCTLVTGNRSIYFYNDSSGPFNPGNPTSISSTKGVNTYIPNTQILYGNNIPLTPPQNVGIIRANGASMLQWDTVTGASAYRIYHSSEAFAPVPWTLLETILAPTTEYELTASESRDFYYIRAISGQ